MLRSRSAVFCAFALCTIGCTETRSYDLSIRNELPTPVTACLTKTNGPAERDWTSPEQLAAPPHPAADETPPGFVIPPGRTAGPHQSVTGQFDPNTGRAYLRIYEGTPGLSQMTAIGPASPRRADVLLRPGVNKFVVRADETGAIEVVPAATLSVTTKPSP